MVQLMADKEGGKLFRRKLYFILSSSRLQIGHIKIGNIRQLASWNADNIFDDVHASKGKKGNEQVHGYSYMAGKKTKRRLLCSL